MWHEAVTPTPVARAGKRPQQMDLSPEPTHAKPAFVVIEAITQG
jgi:hypothetical protein